MMHHFICGCDARYTVCTHSMHTQLKDVKVIMAIQHDYVTNVQKMFGAGCTKTTRRCDEYVPSISICLMCRSFVHLALLCNKQQRDEACTFSIMSMQQRSTAAWVPPCLGTPLLPKRTLHALY